MASVQQTFRGLENLVFGIKDYISGKLYFSGLHDTPTGYLSGYYVRANETGIEYIHPTGVAKELSEHLGAGNGSFTGLQDTPSDYLSGYYIRSTEKGLEYIDPTGLAKTIPSIPQGYLTLEEIPSMPSKHDGELIKVGCDLYLSCEGQWKKVSSDDDSNLLDPSLVPFYPDCVYTNTDAIAYNAYKAEIEAEQLINSVDAAFNGESVADTMSNVCLSANVDGNIVKPNIVSSVSTACDSPSESNTFNAADYSLDNEDIIVSPFDNAIIPNTWQVDYGEQSLEVWWRNQNMVTHGDYAFVVDPRAFLREGVDYLQAIGDGSSYTYKQGETTYATIDDLPRHAADTDSYINLDSSLDDARETSIFNVTSTPFFPPSRGNGDRSNCHYGKLLLYKRDGNQWNLVTDLTLNGKPSQYVYDENGYTNEAATSLGLYQQCFFGRSVAWDGKTLVVGEEVIEFRGNNLYSRLMIFDTSEDGRVVDLKSVIEFADRYDRATEPTIRSHFSEVYGEDITYLVAKDQGGLGSDTAYAHFTFDVFGDTICNLVNNNRNLEVYKKNNLGEWIVSESTAHLFTQRMFNNSGGIHPNFPVDDGSFDGVVFLGAEDKIAMHLGSRGKDVLFHSIRIMTNRGGGDFENYCDLLDFHITGGNTGYTWINASSHSGSVDPYWPGKRGLAFDDGKLVSARTPMSKPGYDLRDALIEEAIVLLDISGLLDIIDEGKITGQQLAELAIQESKEKFEVWANRWKPWFKNLKIVDPNTGIPTGETPSQEDVDELLSWDVVNNLDYTLRSDDIVREGLGLVGWGLWDVQDRNVMTAYENTVNEAQISSSPKVLLNYAAYINFSALNGKLSKYGMANPGKWTKKQDGSELGTLIREFNPSIMGIDNQYAEKSYMGISYFTDLLTEYIKRPVKKRVCTHGISVTDFQSLSIDDYTESPQDYYRHLLTFGSVDKGTYADQQPVDYWNFNSNLLGDSAFADCASDSMGYAELPYLYNRNYDKLEVQNGADIFFATSATLSGDVLVVAAIHDPKNAPMSGGKVRNDSEDLADNVVFNITDCGGYSYILLSDNVKVAIDETSYRWGIFKQGETINITATVGDGCSFIGWSTTDSSILGAPTAETSTLLVPGDVSVVGLFSCK